MRRSGIDQSGSDGLLRESRVGVSFLTEHGRFLARIQGPIHGNVLLRREQYRRADDQSASAALARAYLLAKVANCRTSVLRAAREHPSATLGAACLQLGQSLRLLERAASLDVLRGVEGDAARIYFSVFDQLILHQKEDFFFRERSRRPPMDNINALLSFCTSCWLTIFLPRWKPSGSTPRWAFCIATALAVPALRST